jgi:hypothetical protein
MSKLDEKEESDRNGNVMDHPFEVGGRYENRVGKYEVLEIEGKKMTIQFDDGTRHSVTVSIQARIWQRIQDETAKPPKAKKSSYKSEAIQPVIDLLTEVLSANFSAPYPEDITDQVCMAIEANPTWLDRYDVLVKEFESKGQSGEATVNQAIGFHTKDLTGMVTLQSGVKAKSSLIQTYSRLGYPVESSSSTTS